MSTAFIVGQKVRFKSGTQTPGVAATIVDVHPSRIICTVNVQGEGYNRITRTFDLEPITSTPESPTAQPDPAEELGALAASTATGAVLTMLKAPEFTPFKEAARIGTEPRLITTSLVAVLLHSLLEPRGKEQREAAAQLLWCGLVAADWTQITKEILK